LAWASAAVALTVLGGWMIADRARPALAEPDWNEYLVARDAAGIRPTNAQHPEMIDSGVQRHWIGCLENVVRLYPRHAAAHLALAEAHWRLFEALQIETGSAMPLAHVRDAAEQSRFASRAELVEWLSRAVGEHWSELQRCLDHARSALRLCPLEGRAYVYLAELSFLDGGGRPGRRAMIDQALRVRPFDGDVLYAAANEALLAGDAAGWLDYARRAFHCGPRQQRRIINHLVEATADERLPALADVVLREFQPDLRGLRLLYTACAKRSTAEQMAPLARRLAESAEAEAAATGGAAAVGLWLEARSLYARLGAGGDAVRSAESAVRCDPNNYQAHYQLAVELLKLRSFADAEAHFRWCLQRKPDDRSAAENLRAAVKGRLENQPRSVAGEGARL
jgi:tetratricopeptide (TPR) repeat protein